MEGLRRGRSDAKETEPVKPVLESYVEAVLPYVPPQVAAMVQLQMCSGARPGEVIIMRPCDITLTKSGVWVYRPESHKTEHHGRERRIYLGPRAREILRRWLDRDPEAYCFSPAEAAIAQRAKCKKKRKTLFG